MKINEFQRLVAAHRLSGASVEAARLVLVDGLTKYRAARALDIAESTVGRAVARLSRPLCGHCGQPIISDERAIISDER